MSVNKLQRQKANRLERIRNLIREKGQATISELVNLYKVSETTIRKDLEALCNEGIVRRGRGGTFFLETAMDTQPILQRTGNQHKEKVSIGKLAAHMITNGETIFLGSGSTVIEIARQLPEELELTVITNSLPVANTLAGRDNINLILIGGMLRRSELSFVGHTAEQALAEFRVDKAFMGMRGIDLQHGFTNDYLLEVKTDRAILSIASQIIIVADHTKFNRVFSFLIAPVTAAHVIITDANVPEATIKGLQELGLMVYLAKNGSD